VLSSPDQDLPPPTGTELQSSGGYITALGLALFRPDLSHRWSRLKTLKVETNLHTTNNAVSTSHALACGHHSVGLNQYLLAVSLFKGHMSWPKVSSLVFRYWSLPWTNGPNTQCAMTTHFSDRGRRRGYNCNGCYSMEWANSSNRVLATL